MKTVNEMPNADKLWHLRQTDLVSGLSPSDLEVIASISKDRVYGKGEVIFQQGDPAHSLFMLNRGTVRISIRNIEGLEKILSVFKSGDVFGEDVLDSGSHYRTAATAHEDCWVSIVSREEFTRLIEQRSLVAINFIRILNHRLVEAREEIEAQSFLDVEKRLARVLLKLAALHGRPMVGETDSVKIPIVLSHSNLACLVGANRPHISTIMSRFKKQGLIHYRDRKLVIDTGRLVRAAEVGDSKWFCRNGGRVEAGVCETLH